MLGKQLKGDENKFLICDERNSQPCCFLFLFSTLIMSNPGKLEQNPGCKQSATG